MGKNKKRILTSSNQDENTQKISSFNESSATTSVSVGAISSTKTVEKFKQAEVCITPPLPSSMLVLDQEQDIQITSTIVNHTTNTDDQQATTIVEIKNEHQAVVVDNSQEQQNQLKVHESQDELQEQNVTDIPLTNINECKPVEIDSTKAATTVVVAPWWKRVINKFFLGKH